MNFLTLRSLRTLRFDKLMGPTTASFSNISPKKIRVIGVPLDLGQSRRGVDMGPSAGGGGGAGAPAGGGGDEGEEGGNRAPGLSRQKKKGGTHPEKFEENTAAGTQHAQT